MIKLCKEIAEFIEVNIMGCKFVGIADDGEVFVTFEHDDSDLELAAATHLRKKFPDIQKVTTIVQPSIAEVKRMVDNLNTALDPRPEKSTPLSIGKF